MTTGKGKRLGKRYAELRLRYAIENDEFRRLFDDWMKKQEKETQLCEGYPSGIPYTPTMTRAYTIARKAFDALVVKLNKLGFSYDSGTDIYSDYCQIVKNKKGDLGRGYVIPCVVAKAKLRGFFIRSRKDHRKLIRILKSGSFENNEEWFLEKYRTFEFWKWLEWDVGKDELKSYAFNEKTKRFYYPLVMDNCFLEHSVLEDGRYLTLRIDLTKKIGEIERESKSIVSFFKNIADRLDSSLRKTGARQQDVKLYERYLRVYKSVQKKGEKWTEIAKEIFPEDFVSEEEQLESDSDYIPNPESAIAKVHNDYVQAKRLIAEGLP